MQQIVSIEEMRAACGAATSSGRRLGLVPTMGCLHEGHLSLVRRCRAECDLSAVSIFVNPLQFAPGEDLERYPRDLEGDRAMLFSAGADLLFTPEPSSLYGPYHAAFVEVGGLTDGMCGSRRPGHFRGVATIVAKLFNIVRPDAAYFGQKDWQQAMLISRMVSELDFGIDVVVCPTVRDEDGLALSSRNRYLTDSQRRAAPALHRALDAARARALRGGSSPSELQRIVADELQANGLDLEYVEVRAARSLRSAATLDTEEELVVAAAARLGSTRLIDNVLFRTKAGERGTS